MFQCKFIRISTFIFLVFLPQIAFCQVYKCKSPAGKTIYSESECPSGTIGTQLDLDPNVIDSSALRNRIQQEKSYASSAYSQPAASGNHLVSGNIMSPHDRQRRLRELLMDMNNDAASYEKQADARNEHAYLVSENVLSLSYESELKRRNYKVDLSSSESAKRSHAMRELSAIYREYRE